MNLWTKKTAKNVPRPKNRFCWVWTTNEVGRAQLPSVSTPESNMNPFQSTQNTETELCRFSKIADTELCRFSKSIIGGKCCKSGNCRSANSSPVDNTVQSGADSSVSDGTAQLPSDGTSLSRALPSPAWSRRSRRRRAPITNTRRPAARW